MFLLNFQSEVNKIYSESTIPSQLLYYYGIIQKKD